MTKQKVVIKVVSMNGHKSRSKALKIAVGISGVESAALQGDDKSQIEVKGEGIDAVELTSLLRKNVGYAELISVAEEKKEEGGGGGEKKEDDQSKVQPMVWPPPYVPTYEIYGVPVSNNHYAQQPSCSIM